MADDQLTVKGLPELVAKIKNLSQLRAAQGALKAAGLHIKGLVAVYPPRRHLTRYQVYGRTWESAKQRRAFFWLLRKGKIEVPYRRGESPGSQTFGRRWTISTANSGMTVIVGNNTNYGPLLMDREQQTRYAKVVGWDTVQGVIEEEGPTVSRFLMQVIERIIAE